MFNRHSLKQITVLFLSCVAFFTPFLLRDWPYGFDSYYYLNVVCNGAGFVSLEPLLSQLYFGGAGCVIPGFVVINFFLLFVSSLAISALGEKFCGKHGWLAGVFALQSFVWILAFAGIESEPFAFTYFSLATASFYCSENWKGKLIGFALGGIACLFWPGAFLGLVAFSLSSLWLTFPIVGIGALLFWRQWQDFIPNLNVQENWPGFGLFYQGFLLISFKFARMVPKLFVPTLFFVVVACINLKFAPFAAVFLAVLAAKQVSLSKIGYLRWLPFVGLFFSLLFFWFVTPFLPPSIHEIEAVQLAVQDANGSTICNQWGYGHLVEFFGGVASDKAGGQQLCTACEDCTVLGFGERPGCELLNVVDGNAEVKVWHCPAQ